MELFLVLLTYGLFVFSGYCFFHGEIISGLILLVAALVGCVLIHIVRRPA